MLMELAPSGKSIAVGQLPDGPRTDPGVQFSRTGLLRNTRFRNQTQAVEVANLTLGRPTIRGRSILKCLSISL